MKTTPSTIRLTEREKAVLKRVYETSVTKFFRSILELTEKNVYIKNKIIENLKKG